MENFAKAKSAFPQWGEGKSTGPNSSQVTDGGAAVVLMKRSKAQVCLRVSLSWMKGLTLWQELGLEILGKHVTTSVIGEGFLLARKYPKS
jgi:acetyl-CoA acyltransferase 1